MDERDEIVADLRERARYYETLDRVGIPPIPEPPPSAAASRVLPTLTGRESSTPVAVGAAPAAIPASGLEEIRATIGDCQRCKLAGGRKTIVFGQGNPNARLMFVGEGPGADEDEQGLAFVGKAGQLLTKIIEAIGLRRDDVFIANVIKCRPPQNRNPEPDEILACQPFLEQQIRAIQPAVLVGLGKFAAQWLLKTAEPISRIRGRLGDYEGIKVMPTWHPAYLLRNPGAKREVWEDMKVVRSLIDG
jgi:uracil-DNA glycosylase